MRRLGISLMAAVLATAGCTTVGPNFKPPAAPSATRYVSPSETSPSGADAGSAAPRQSVALGTKVAGQWWTLYRSPDLDRVVKQAIAGSPTLESAKARLAEAREEVAATRGAQYPQLTLDGNFSRQKESAATFGLAPGAFPLPPNFNLFQVGPTASYDLDLFGGLRRRIEQQSALADFQSDQLDAAYLTLTGNTVAQALQVAAIRAQLKAVSDIVDIDRQISWSWCARSARPARCPTATWSPPRASWPPMKRPSPRSISS